MIETWPPADVAAPRRSTGRTPTPAQERVRTALETVAPATSEVGEVRIGVDIGQVVDPTAIAVVEGMRRPRPDYPEDDEDWFPVRALEQMPLGSGYAQCADRIVEIAARIMARRPGIRPRVYVDNTGVGRPVVEMLRGPLREIGVPLYPVTLTAGDEMRHRVVRTGKPTPSAQVTTEYKVLGRQVSCGKVYLASRLQALLQTQRVVLPGAVARGMGAHLQEQLRAFQIKAKASGADEIGGAGGVHDDLVIALGLAVLDDVRGDAEALRTANEAQVGSMLPVLPPAASWRGSGVTLSRRRVTPR